MPEPEKLERVPPETVTSAATKSLTDSERVNVRLAVCLAFKEETSEEMAMLGLTVSTEMVTVLLALEPSVLVLPAASENFVDATEITPLAVLSAVGVKVAV